MLKQFGPSTFVAIFVGIGLAFLAFVPVAVYRYRRHGRLRFFDVVTLVLVACYAVALWSYTLIPLPESKHFSCMSAQLHPFQFVADIAEDGRTPWRNRALLQAVFNVVLFAPLGYFLRVLAKRGWIVATASGAVISLLIELTQKTGVWGFYRCAYRVFDVDDLMLNTVGALVGSLVAIPVVLVLQRRRPPAAVTAVTLGRRVIGIVVDLTVIAVIGAGLTVAWRMFCSGILGWSLDQLPGWVDLVLGVGVPAVVEGYWVIVRGRTIGEAAVQLHPVPGSLAEPASRVLKFCFGVGGYLAVTNVSIPVPLLGFGFVVASVVLLGPTRSHRGLSHLVSGMELRLEDPDPEAESEVPAPTPTPMSPEG
ncbi:glycopeptide antibiotics resistance protein [Propionicimonas paludicola]|uniref:Glycopeptide antibiotics resistance protein n=1 Tax=Propionicimonas paludicola TaxID=185243 RepID=A0A2A9CNH8_9ACTN|nr:VanZ family protein [Propionicimonas paludicola]PFG16007.1 glycopeptide antibiotics resistance protein [Propionicimonas paludicola]